MKEVIDPNESSIVVAETIEHPPLPNDDGTGTTGKPRKSIGHYFIGK